MQLLPVLKAQPIADERGGASDIAVGLFIEAESGQPRGTFFILRPGIEIPYPFSVMVDLNKIRPLFLRISGSVKTVEESHAGGKNQDKRKKLQKIASACAPVG